MRNLVRVTLENGTTFTGTDTHPAWLPDVEEWIRLGDLQAGDRLETLAGPIAVRATGLLLTVSDVYNIETHGHHVYRITDDGVLVHNNGACVGAEGIVADNLEATNMLRKLHPDDPDVLDDALIRGKASGSYVNRHASGTSYIGKGGPARAKQSSLDVAKRTRDPHVSTNWESAIDETQALIDEARKIRQHGGIQNLHNRINSPGEKFL